MLQIMKIPTLMPKRKDAPFKVVLWDTGSTNHYVRIGHAETMGFPSRKEMMRVCTIGGDIKTIDGILYQCQIIDRDGNVEEFIAHALVEVTRTLSNP